MYTYSRNADTARFPTRTGTQDLLREKQRQTQTDCVEKSALKMKIVMRLVAVAFLLVAFVVQASAQTSSASISGHVVDQSKSAIPNAEVKLLDQSTNVV